MKANKEKQTETNVTIKPPSTAVLEIAIRGIEPLVVSRFNKKGDLMAKMSEGGAAKNKKERKARDYDLEAQDAKHISDDGWEGICASAFRAACISACRLVNFKMTLAKISIFVVADGRDKEERSPLVRIYGPKAITYTAHTRNATGVIDIRSRPMYQKWGCLLKIRYDTDQFTAQDVANLVARVGLQVGLCEGRPDSKSSAGLGFGLFEIVPSNDVTKFKKEYQIP